jgi:hypothetical protein
MSDTTETPDMPDATEALEDFDAFWQSRKRKQRTVTIMGETVPLPASLPLQFQLEAQRLQRSKRDQDIRKLLVILLSDEDCTDRWAAKGMDLEQFAVLVAWLPQVIAGRDITLAEVADQLEAAEAKQAAPKA